MSLRRQRLATLGFLVLVVAVAAAACSSRTVVGQQNGGHGGGAGTSAAGQGGYAGTADNCNPTTADCVGRGGTTGIAGTYGPAGTTGEAGAFGGGGTTGLGGSGVPTGEAGVGSPGACAVGGSGGSGLAFHPAVQYPIRRESWSVALGDFNGDGKPDFAVANQRTEDQIPVGGAGGWGGYGGWGTAGMTGYSGSVSVLLSESGSGYAPPQHYLVGETTNSIAVADLNGDGKVDLAVSTPGAVNVLFNSGTGTLATPVSFITG